VVVVGHRERPQQKKKTPRPEQEIFGGLEKTLKTWATSKMTKRVSLVGPCRRGDNGRRLKQECKGRSCWEPAATKGSQTYEQS